MRELRGLEDHARARPGNFDAKGWNGISLVMAEGRADDTRSPAPSRSGPRPTPALERCPAHGEIIASLPGPILAARLLYLEPGGSAAQHRDAIGFAFGGVRLHVPIVTHPDVELWIGGERMRWEPGELWYADFAFPHRLANPSSVTRVHLVIDIAITDALLELFPPALVPALVAGGVCRHRPVVTIDASALHRFEGRWHVPRALFLAINAPEDLSFEQSGEEPNTLVARGPDGEIVFVLDPLDERTLAIRGYYQGITFEASEDGRVELVHRGRVTFDPETFDENTTPWDLFTTRTPLERSPASP